MLDPQTAKGLVANLKALKHELARVDRWWMTHSDRVTGCLQGVVRDIDKSFHTLAMAHQSLAIRLRNAEAMIRELSILREPHAAK